MKKITLITIVCLLITCFGIFGQASASDFSIEGTLWRGQLKGVVVTKDPFEVERVTVDVKFGFSDGEIYHCAAFDGDTCTPEPLPEGFDAEIMSNLGLVVLTANGEGCMGYKMVIHAVITMFPRGVGFLTARQSAWDDEGQRVSIEFLNGSLIRESEAWSPQ